MSDVTPAIEHKNQPPRSTKGPTSQPWTRHDFILAAALLLVTVATYLPAIRAGYIWDDDFYVTGNLALRTDQGLLAIWTRLDATPQYYPLVFTSFWVEHHLWGDYPLGYHLLNVLLHVGTSIMLWRLLRRLGLAGAWLVAAVFAVHPVNVESVAWISERKNVLSGCLALGAASLYLRFAMPEFFTRRRSIVSIEYCIAFALFVLALFAKTVACTLPATLLLLIWWKRGRLRMLDVLPLIPFFVVGAGMGAITGFVEKTHVGAVGPMYDFTKLQRILIATRAVWFYATKLFIPVKLTFIYPRWHVDPHQLWQFMFPIAAVAVIVAAWALRRRYGRGILVAPLYYGGVLVPALGFVNVYPMRYSFVADHFQYLASIGLIALVVAASSKAMQYRPGLFRAFGAALLLLCASATFAQCRMYGSSETLWKETIVRNPGASIGYVNLGVVEYRRQSNELAEELFVKTLEIDPTSELALFNLAQLYARQGRQAIAIDYYRRCVTVNPQNAAAHDHLGYLLQAMDRNEDAIVQYRLAMNASEHDMYPVNHLAALYNSRGQRDLAIALLRRDDREEPNPMTSYNLATFLAEEGARSEAIFHIHRALQMRPNYPLARTLLEKLTASAPITEMHDIAPEQN